MFKSTDLCDLVQIDLSRVRALRAAIVDEPAVSALADTFRVLGDPTRVRIIDALSHGELCVCDLAAVLGHSQSAVSHQLRLMRGLRLVRARREGRMVFYSLDDRHIVTLFKQGLRHVQEAAPGRAVSMRANGARRAGAGGRAR
jgi:ArsR family transcriptional regulator